MKLGFDFDLAEKCERSYHYPIPEKENHAQKSMSKSPMLKSYATEEQIDQEFSTIENLIRCSAMCEKTAAMCRNLNDPISEDRYLTEAIHALEAARQLFILIHK